MARSHEDGEEEGGQRGEEGDALGVLAQQLFGNLDEPVHTSGGLHDACAGNGGYDDIDDIGRWCTWF